MKKMMGFICMLAAAVSAMGHPPIEDLQGWINQQIGAGATQIKVPKGIYRLSPQAVAHLEFRGLEKIEIDFQGSEIVCTDRTRALHLENCDNVTIRNAVIDYDPKLYTQGRVLAATSQYFDLSIFKGYPTRGLRAVDAEVFDSETHELKANGRTFHDLSRIEYLDGRTIRIHRRRHLQNIDGFVEPGDIMLIKTEAKRIDGGKYTPHGVYSEKCTNVTFDQVTVYAANCFSFLGQNCRNIRYYRCRVDRRKNDPTVEYPRMRASNWDAYHSINAEVGPTIEECYAGYMGDDSVNIRGDYHIVMRASDAELTVLAKFDLNIQPGDPVEIVSRDGRLIGRAVATARQLLSEFSAAEKNSALSVFTLINPQNCKQVWRVTLDREINIEDVSVICALNRIGSGFKVINNTLGHSRGRGILTKAKNGLISGNLIEETALESLKLSPNISNWLEAAYYENVVVSNNTIRNGKLSVHFGSGIPAQILIGGCRSGLTFVDNTIEYNGDTAMIVSDLNGGIIKNNTFKRIDGSGSENPIRFENCSNIERE